MKRLILLKVVVSGFFVFGFSFSTLASVEDDCLAAKVINDKISFCTQAIAASPKWEFFNDRAIAYRDKGDTINAIKDFEAVVKLNPTSTRGYIGRGSGYWTRGEFDLSIEDFNKAVSLDPKEYIAYLLRAQSWREKRNFSLALDDANEVIRLLPNRPDGFRMRATIWNEQQFFDKAISDLNEAIKISPTFALAYATRAASWRLAGNLKNALDDANRAVELAPTVTVPYFTRGDIYRYIGNFEGAIADYNKSLTVLPDNVPALTGLGLTYEKMADVAKARNNFNAAINSTNPYRFTGDSRSSMETAKARLAALDSGATVVKIQNVSLTPSIGNSVPTRALDTAIKPSLLSNETGSRRVALVIGNSKYANVPALVNPKKDSAAIATALKNIGFEVVSLANDQTREQMINALRNFANEAEKADWAMVYYAGHGMEVGGVNYLIPIDAKIAVDRDIQFEAVPLAQVLNAADTAKKIKLVMLDACRDNPFKPRQTTAPEVIAAAASTAGAPIKTRSSNGRGLAEVKVTGATLVVYAAKDGQVALDGEGGNSPFAVAVVQRLATPGVEINKLFRLVRDDVMEATAGRQEPYTYGSLPGKEDFFFVAK